MSESSDDGRKLVWDLPVRVFHWALVASFAGAYALSESERLRHIHVMLGYTVAGLVAFRLLWGLIGSRYARFSSFAYGPGAAIRYLKGLVTGRAEAHVGHNPAGSWSIYAIVVLAMATCVTGYLNFQEVGGDAVEELHELFANAWLVVVGLHVAGVLASSLAHRENLVAAMVTGYKRGVTTAGGRPQWAVGVTLAAAVLAFWTWTLATGGAGTAGPGPAASTLADAGIADDDDADEDAEAGD